MSGAPEAAGWRPIRAHPDNPKYFLFRGRPRALLCATEHYGSVLNRRFDFERYPDEAADRRQTPTRLFPSDRRGHPAGSDRGRGAR